MRSRLAGRLRWGLRAGAVAGLLSGGPSTAHALATGRPLLESTRAAGTLVLRGDRSPVGLLAGGLAAHTALSLGWGAVLGLVLPRRAPIAAGAAAGLAIAAIDLGLVGRRNRRVDALPKLPQVLDHLAYGMVVGAVLRASDR